MKKYEIYNADCRDALALLVGDSSVQCCVTSPPYFGLRDYGVDGQIGLEQTPDEFVAELVAVFREVRRVLRDDGTLWLNLGDSYAGYHGNKNAAVPTSATNGWTNGTNENRRGDKRPQDIGLKPKDLIGIPWRVAFALQADGWYLRQDIIWHKPNPMPESVRDRCTKAHEYIFLFSKSPRYYFDADAIKEPAAGGNSKGDGRRLAEQAIARTGGVISGGTAKSTLGTSAAETRNRRGVWTVSTKPFKGAHFATFPPDLIEPCILAGSKPGDIVLDPFGGSGTTAAVALKHGRRTVLCELNPEYVAIAEARIAAAMEKAA